MKYVLAFFSVLAGLWQAFITATKAAGAAEERVRADTANEERLERQNKVAQKPVTNDEVDKSLRDGTF